MLADTKIRWLDISSGPRSGSISDLIKENSHLIRQTRAGDSLMLVFPDDINIMVPDLTGWTKIFSIWIYNVVEWCSIKIDNTNYEIMVPTRELVPIYDPDYAMDGFHGEVKYPYILKNPEKISPGDKMRVIKDTQSEFHTPVILDIRERNLQTYEIHTRSRFMNVSGFNMFADNMITLEEMQSWDSDQGYKSFR